MSDALPLPPRPDLEQYKKLARDLQRACQASEPEAIVGWATRWAGTLARLRGTAPTPEPESEVRKDARRILRQWTALPQNDGERPCTLTAAQFVVARCHGFASWPRFARHLQELASADSAVSQFERAADAIAAGDLDTFAALLRENAELPRARSTREHRSTLLHYVSANGIEDFRQKTPRNIVEIATLLLDRGADVNAESEAYGGGSTALGLTATSYPPEAAGMQLPLMELFLQRGAVIGAKAIGDSLRNGRREAAELYARHGAPLDLEAAAGVGRLDVVRGYFAPDGALLPPATPKMQTDAFAWACEFGRTAVVEFLLEQGVPVTEKLPHDGHTGLHWAAWGGYTDTVKLLLDRGAPVGVRDDSYGGTPLDWALYAWGNGPVPYGDPYEVVALLVGAGALFHLSWFDQDDEDRRRVLQKLETDSRMRAALMKG